MIPVGYCQCGCGQRTPTVSRTNAKRGHVKGVTPRLFVPGHRVSAESRFWPKVDKSGGQDSCWLWTGARTPDGYGSFGDGERVRGAHRYAWELAHGPVPPDMHVLHRCDVRHCVNEGHLFLGTNADNVADRNMKHRQARGDRHGSVTRPDAAVRGEQHPKAKLSEADVRRIRVSSKSIRRLGAEFGVSSMTISQIKRHIIWKWLT